MKRSGLPRSAPVRTALVLACLVLGVAGAQEPGEARWIWGSWADALGRPSGEKCWFRKTVSLAAPVREATAFVASDNHFALWVNGAFAGRGDSWQQATRLDLAHLFRVGENVVAVEGRNDSGPAALLAFGEVVLDGGTTVRIETDATWTTSPDAPEGWKEPGFDARSWQPARAFGKHGEGPWVGVSFEAAVRFEPLPGFRVETVREGVGSLIAMTLDGGGGIFVSTEGGGVLRLADAVEEFTTEVTNCQGLLWSRGALFAVGRGPEGPGLYRIEGSTRRVSLLGRFGGEDGEHGAHAVVEGPDGFLWVVLGNHATLDEPWSAESPYRIHYEGHLLPRHLDPRGHATRVRSPGGIVLRTDREGKEWRVIAGGLRNAYDLAFDERGSLFAFDSDMEWDVGLPWYRPVRLLHVVPGGEYGWRTGSSKWPDSYADSLPAAIEVGRGSPTGLCLYRGRSFPARFRGALLGGDWSQGRILAFHLEPGGVSYGGTAEVLLRGRPLAVTDLEVDGDGSLLFCTGGRGAQGGVYRLLYAGPPETEAGAKRSKPAAFPEFGARTPIRVPVAALSSADRFVRFAGARALERRDPSLWEEAALARDDALARAEALVALARGGLARTDGDACARRIEIARETLAAGATGEARLAALRALELLLLDPDAPAPEECRELAAVLHRLFPSGDRAADREIAVLLAHLGPEGAPEALLDQLGDEPSRAEQIHLAYALRATSRGWTAEGRERFLRWLDRARDWTGGFSFEGYVEKIRGDFLSSLEPAERVAIGAEVRRPRGSSWSLPHREGAEPRDFDETLTFLRRTAERKRRSADEGALVFERACASCHRAGAIGGGAGPDLTTVSARFSVADILEKTLLPSRRIPDLYRALDVATKDGTAHSGLPLVDDGSRLVLLRSDGERVEIPAEDVETRRPSPRSLMPDGLLDAFTLEEVADLFAFLGSPERATLPGASAWRPLFDGKTLEGWEGDPALWRVEEGAIVGRASALPGSRFLVSRESFADFVLECEVLLEGGNSGLQFRSARRGDHALEGYQADAGESWWGSLYEEGGRGMLVQVPFDIWRSVVRERGWNHVVVSAVADRLRLEWNGVTTVDLRDGRSAGGLLGLQLHAGGATRVRFRHLRVRTTGLPPVEEP